MSTMNHDPAPCPLEDPAGWPDDEPVELVLLLPGQHAAKLERAAHRCGLSLGELIRQFVRDYLAGRGGSSLSCGTRPPFLGADEGLTPGKKKGMTVEVVPVCPRRPLPR